MQYLIGPSGGAEPAPIYSIGHALMRSQVTIGVLEHVIAILHRGVLLPDRCPLIVGILDPFLYLALIDLDVELHGQMRSHGPSLILAGPASGQSLRTHGKIKTIVVPMYHMPGRFCTKPMPDHGIFIVVYGLPTDLGLPAGSDTSSQGTTHELTAQAMTYDRTIPAHGLQDQYLGLAI